ncbi:MAG: RNA polymerase sigma factor [Clostridia bacterium]|nr:RNA polymerase sigma factor [Clostridia bacterium]
MLNIFVTVQSENSIRRPIDDGLIEKISTGDTDAFRELYETASKSVYGFALSILKNSCDAEDVLQETFIRVFTYASSYTAKGKPMAWILRITRNLAVAKLREKSKNAEYDDGQSEKIDFSTVTNIEKRLLLEKIFEILTDDEKQIVVLHCVSGLKYREISDILSCPLNTVISKYHRAIKKLRNGLEE